MGACKSKKIVKNPSNDSFNVEPNRVEDIYQIKYEEIEFQHKHLQEKFLDLKSKFENGGDFKQRLDELNKKLQDTILEREEIRETYDRQIKDMLEYQQFREENFLSELKLSSARNENSQEIGSLKSELEILKLDNENKNEVLMGLSETCEQLQSTLKSQKKDFDNELKNKTVLLNGRHEREKKNLNFTWESKLNDVAEDFRIQIKNIKNNSKQECAVMKDDLSKVLKELEVMKNRNRSLNQELEELKARYDRRESRHEDLEKIADLEGQLLIQTEDLDKQKKLLRGLKVNVQSSQVPIASRRNRKNSRR